MRRPNLTPLWRAAIAVGACLWLICAAAPSAAAQKVCGSIDLKNPATLNDRAYRVRDVRVKTQLDFIHAISNYLKETKADFPLKPGRVLPLALPLLPDGTRPDDILHGIVTGREMIEKRLDEGEAEADPRSRIRVVIGGVENCDETSTPPQLDIVYRVFLTNYDAYLSHTLELKSKEAEKPATTAGETKADTGVLVKPSVGYNRTRRLFGGGLFQLKRPGGVIEKVELGGDGSTTSNAQDFDASGARAPGLAGLSHFEYHLSYKHSDLPAAANRLREGRLSFQAFGASSPLGKSGVVLRYGASLEGGNQQTDFDAAAIAQGSAPDSGYGGLKAYVGATMRRGGYALAGSYGVQLGTRGATTDVDFVKHLGDLSLNARLFKNRTKHGLFLKGKPGEIHKALTVEARLTAGRIHHKGLLPVAQRFFGGNRQRNFIEGDNWNFLSGPFIRSIPENRLNPTAGDIGGTSFYSANLLVGREAWGYPLLPKDIAEDERFDPALNASIESARSILRNTYLRKVPEYAAFAASVSSKTPAGSTVTLSQWLAGLKVTLDGLADKLPEDLDDEKREAIEMMTGLAAGELVKFNNTFKKSDKNLPSVLRDFLTESTGEGCYKSDEDFDECSRLTLVRIWLKRLSPLLLDADPGLGVDAAALLAAEAELKRRQDALVAEMDRIDTSLATRLANVDMEEVETALDAFVNELNIVAVSPVAVFDVARVWPDNAGTRFGVGGGARISLINFNLTLGYSFNPRRRPGDGRGAFFFTMDFTDIFR
jgi:hypothetical protein